MRAAVIVLLALTGCATASPGRQATFPSAGDLGQLADSATTAVALESGLREGNPVLSGLSWPAIAALKLGVSQASKLLPEPACVPTQVVLGAGGFGAATWNLGVLAGAGLWGAPAAVAVVILGWDWFVRDARATCRDPWVLP